MLSAAHPHADVRIVAKEGAALAAAGHEVTHLAPGLPPAASSQGVALRGHAGRRGWRARILGIRRLAREAAALRPQAIQAHEPDAWVAALLAARRCGAKVVLDVHEHYPSRLDARLPRLLRPLARGALTLACRAIASRAAAVVVAKEGLDDAFPHAVPVRNYAADPAIPPRRHAPGPLRLLHLGALGAARGAFAMLDLLAARPDATLVLVGRFTDGSGPAFASRAAALGLADRIETHGWLPREEALCIAAGCDVALILFQPGEENHRLALPHKLFDAMWLGLPVIVPRFAEQVAAVVRESRCGIAVETGDVARIAAAVAQLADPATRAELGANGRAAAATRYGWAAEAARLVALYETLSPRIPRRPAGAAASGGG